VTTIILSRPEVHNAVDREAAKELLDLILAARPVEAHEALQMGLVNRVVPKGLRHHREFTSILVPGSGHCI